MVPKVICSVNNTIPKILAIMGAMKPFIEVKTAFVLLISINLKVLPKNVEKIPTPSNPIKGIG